MLCHCVRLQELVEGELKDMEHFFTIFPTAFTDFNSDSYKTSVVGKHGGCCVALLPTTLGNPCLSV